jgi:prepilin-type N-terminal cleavage/methylation domain-containing protein
MKLCVHLAKQVQAPHFRERSCLRLGRGATDSRLPAGVRRGFSLLELMLALGLLGGLLAVAWSLMGTFKNAEQRGWRLASQTQTIRAARQWLEADLLHVISSPDPLTRFGPPRSPQAQLVGTSTSLTLTVSPSLDPIPLMQQLLAGNFEENGTSSAEVGGAGRVASRVASRGLASRGPRDLRTADRVGFASGRDGVDNGIIAPQTAWTEELLRVHYQVRPVLANTATGNSAATSERSQAANAGAASLAADNEQQFELVRREMIDPGLLGDRMDGEANDFDSNMSTGAMGNSTADRELTTADLYRQTDQQQQSMQGLPISESRLRGLIRPQFRYSDGTQWLSEWNSLSRGSLPTAVALAFDFPTNSEMNRPEPGPAIRPEAVDSELAAGRRSSDVAGADGIDALMSSMPLAEETATANDALAFPSAHQVHVVVSLEGHFQDPRDSSAADPSQQGVPQADGPSEGFGNGDYNLPGSQSPATGLGTDAPFGSGTDRGSLPSPGGS